MNAEWIVVTKGKGKWGGGGRGAVLLSFLPCFLVFISFWKLVLLLAVEVQTVASSHFFSPPPPPPPHQLLPLPFLSSSSFVTFFHLLLIFFVDIVTVVNIRIMF